MRVSRVSQAFGIFKVRENGNIEYWVSQFVVLLSTVLGVYLAAQAGYATAMQFEVTRGEREGYYLRRALLTEIKANLKAVDEWSQRYDADLRAQIDPNYFLPNDDWVHFFNDKMGWSHLAELTNSKVRMDMRSASLGQMKTLRQQNELLPGELKMKSFIWDTMKQQVTTFQLPPDLITTVQNYYESMDGNIKDVRSNTEKAGPAAVAIHAETRRMREVVVTYFETEMADLRSRLEAKGVNIH